MTQAAARQRAKDLGLERKIGLSERGILWSLLAFITGAALLALLILFLQGHFENIDPDVWGPVARGYSAYGEILGVMAVVFSLATFIFSLRKRSMQERFPIFRGTMMAWLWFHVTSGVLALIAATLHAGFGLFDYDFSTGKLLYWLLLFIAATGLLWRLVYSVVPKSAAPKVGNYSREASLQRAREQELEIEKRAAGGSETLQQWKSWLLERARSPQEMDHARQNFQGSPEQPVFNELCALAESRNRAIARNTLQRKLIGRLQGFRIWHVPISFLFIALIVVHVIEVYDIPANTLPPSLRSDTSLPVALTGNHDPKDCAECHREIYEQWEHSMHAHALTSPVMVAQSNQVTRTILADAESPDPKRICVNCHSPLGTELAQQEILPYPGGKHGNQGVTCLVCHQFKGETRPVGGAYTDGIIGGIERGRVMYGPFAGAVGNPYHSSKLSPVLSPDPYLICQNCHNVAVDRNGNDRIDVGPDLVLQTTQLEYLEYRENGGQATCGDCHMPLLKATRVAEAAGIPDLQDTKAPKRLVHDHSFVGTDYPLDKPGKSDPHRAKRVALLRSAATMKLEQSKFDSAARSLTVSVNIRNTGTGHTLPTGFAFARQMWVELIVKNAVNGQAVFVSGLLAKNTDDLCDSDTMLEPGTPMLPFIQSCSAPDPQLLSFQKKLVSKSTVKVDAQGNPVTNARGEQIPILAEGGHETSIQHLTGNAIARTRPSDGKVMASLQPGEGRSFVYSVPVPPGVEQLDISARLLFRNLPPYFLRHLASNQPKDEVPQIAPLIKNLDIVEMSAQKTRFALPLIAGGIPAPTASVPGQPAPAPSVAPQQGR